MGYREPYDEMSAVVIGLVWLVLFWTVSSWALVT